MKAIVHREEDRTKAMLTSLFIHLGLLALLIFYRFAQPSREDIMVAPTQIVLEWGGGGDDAALGEPDRGQGDNPAPQGQQMDDPSSTTEADDPAQTPSANTPVPPKSETKAETAKNNPVTTDNPEVAAVKKAQEDAKKRQEQERIRQEKETAQRLIAEKAERQRKIQEEADRKRREQEDYNKKKGKFGSTFGNGTGAGQGKTATGGNQGINTGDGNNPLGKSAGSGGGTGGGQGTGAGGSVGGGLGGRKVTKKVAAEDNSQKDGTVRIKVCVDSDGKVTSAEPTLAGSTTSDGTLRAAAKKAAYQWRFGPGNDNDCGWIEFNFILK